MGSEGIYDSRTAAEEYELPDVGVGNSSTPRVQRAGLDRSSPRTSSSQWDESRRPAIPTTVHPRKTSSGKKTITFHGNSSVIFSTGQDGLDGGSPVVELASPRDHSKDLPGSPYRRRRRTIGSATTTPVLPPSLHLPSNMNHHALFLSEEAIQGNGIGHGPTQTVEMPDFGGLLGLNAEGEDNYLVARGIKQDWKRRLFLLMEEPGSGRDAFAVHVLSTSAILLSALLTTFSTLPSFYANSTAVKTLFGLDVTIVVLFTVEYLARLVAHTDSIKMFWKWCTSFFAIIDLLAILPFYIEVAMQEDTATLFRFSILRTLRLLRVFRAFKYQNRLLFTIEVMYIAVHRSKDALVALSFFLVMALVVFSTLIYFAERGTWDSTLETFISADGNPSDFVSIPAAAWFVLVTITTVGYGETTPRSVLGRVITVPLLVFGLLLVALPSFVLGRNFAIIFDLMQGQLGQPVNPVALEPTSARSEGEDPERQQDSTATGASNAHYPDRPAEYPPQGTYNTAGGSSRHSRASSPSTGQHDGSNVPLLNVVDTSMSGDLFSRPTSAQGMHEAYRSREGQPLTPAEYQHQEQQRQQQQSQQASQGSDLSNAKLAMNQSVLLRHIERLSAVQEKQGEVLERMVRLLDRLERDGGTNDEEARAPIHGLGLERGGGHDIMEN